MTPEFATCPEHPEAPALGTCARCGRFVCGACRAGAYCRACAETANDPLGVVATPFSLGASVRNGFRLFGAVLPELLVLAAIFAVVSTLFSMAVSAIPHAGAESPFTRLTSVFDWLVGLVGEISALALLIGAAEGRRMGVAESLRYGTGLWGRVFVVRFYVGLWVALFTLLLLVPGIWKSTTLAFAVVAAVRAGHSEEPLAMSTELVAGRWWQVFGSVLVFVLVAYAPPTAVAATIAGVVAALELPDAAVWGSDLLVNFATQVSEQLYNACLLAAFYGLSRSTGRELPGMNWRDRSE